MKTFTHDNPGPMQRAMHAIFRADHLVERACLIKAAQCSLEYDGGTWAFDTNDEGTLGFLYPTSRDHYKVDCTNYFSHPKMDSRSFGAALTLLSVNHLCWRCHEDGIEDGAKFFHDLYFQLRDWVFDLSDAGELDGAAIAGFID